MFILLFHPACSPGWRRAGVGRSKCLCIVLMQKLVNSIAARVRIKTGLGNGCIATRGLAGQG